MAAPAVLDELKDLKSLIKPFPSGRVEVGVKQDGRFGDWTLLRFRDIYRLRLNTDAPVYIGPDGQKLLSQIAATLYAEMNEERQTAFKNKEWTEIVFHCFADVVATTDNVKTIPSDTFYQTLLASIESEEKAATGPRTHLFGCHLSNLSDFPGLPAIGPVAFEPRLDWVGQTAEAGRLDLDDATVLRDHWQNGQSGDANLTGSAGRIARTVGGADFVCSVTVKRPMGAEAGHNIALMAAHLALTAISLGFPTPSKALRDMRLTWDDIPHEQASVTRRSQSREWALRTVWEYSEGGIGSFMSKEKWSEYCSDHAQVFKAAGDAIDWFVQGSDYAVTDHPKMAAALHQALLWFHAGCRQKVNPMALANFMTSLDALTKGRRKIGIRELVEVCLPDSYDEALRNRIDELYDDPGRSRLLHGVSDRLGCDWTHDRALGEQLARHCLLDCLEVFAGHAGNDNPEAFITSRRAVPDQTSP